MPEFIKVCATFLCCVWWQSYMCMYNILLKHLSSTSSSCCIYRYCREGKSNDEFPQSCGGRTQRYVCVLALAGMCVPVSLYTFSLSLSLDLGTAFVNIGMYEPQQSASVAFTDFGNAHKWVQLSIALYGCIVHVIVWLCVCVLAEQWERKERNWPPRLVQWARTHNTHTHTHTHTHTERDTHTHIVTLCTTTYYTLTDAEGSLHIPTQGLSHNPPRQPAKLSFSQ